MHVSSNFEKNAQVLLSYLGAKLHSGIFSRRWKPCYLQISGCSAHRRTLNTSHFFCKRGINRSFSTVYESVWQPAECDSASPLLNVFACWKTENRDALRTKCELQYIFVHFHFISVVIETGSLGCRCLCETDSGPILPLVTTGMHSPPILSPGLALSWAVIFN